jgi:thiosulfate/3-mercaptopyruvate sulfurtransferase
MVKNAKLKPDDGAANLVLDARPSGRFTGKDPEPRPGLSSGHMPHSLSLTFNRLLQQHTNPKTGKQYTTMLDPPELEKVFRQVLGDKNYEAVLAGKQSITNTCGSGMTAAVIWLALQTLGVQSSIYDEVSNRSYWLGCLCLKHI